MLIVVQGIRELGIEDIELPYGFKDMWDIRIMLQHAMQKCRGMQTLHRMLTPGRSQECGTTCESKSLKLYSYVLFPVAEKHRHDLWHGGSVLLSEGPGAGIPRLDTSTSCTCSSSLVCARDGVIIGCQHES